MTNDEGQFVSPPDWDFSIYSFEPKKFFYSTTYLPVTQRCSVARYEFRGRVRFYAGLKKPGLTLCFIDNGSTVGSGFQGIKKLDSILKITPGDHDWDGISDVGAFGVEISFDEPLARKVLSPDILNQLEAMKRAFGTSRSIVIRPTRSAMKLKDLSLFFLKSLETSDSATRHKRKKSGALSSIDIPSALIADPQFHEDTLVEMSRNILQEAALGPPLGGDVNRFRQELALTIERLLWEAPFVGDPYGDTSLDELSAFFKVSRRTIQLAMQEQFGIGFTSLRRLIRLHQVRNALRTEAPPPTVESLANLFYRGHPGRLARGYKELFGVLPSIERKKNRLG